MTPLEALIKNIATLGLLWYLYRNVKEAENNRIEIPLLILALSVLLVFVLFPFCPCGKEKKNTQVEANQSQMDSTQLSLATVEIKKDTGKAEKVNIDEKEEKKEDPGPKPVTSRFASFTNFSGKSVNLDKGKAIVCMFAPGCDHCMATAKELNQLSAKAGFPPVYILFMDEEANKIPDFFKFAGRTFPYQVLDIPKFWKTMGPGGGTPGVYYLWNGNLRKSFEGTEDKKFDKNQLLKELGLN